MKIRAGYEITFDCPQPTPMVLTLNVHPSRAPDLLTPDRMVFDRPAAPAAYHDGFGNLCTRIVAPAGLLTITNDFVVMDSGEPDAVAPGAVQHAVEDLPADTLVFLLGSRYCETDLLSDTAWSLFGAVPPGWERVQAICGYVHERITFGYEHARSTKTARDAYMEQQGVCRDFAHLAVAFCRCMNIPARYCTGYLGDIGVPPPDAPMDFSGWFEAYLDGAWHAMDARHNKPRIGRLLMARGRDATDAAISTAFGNADLMRFDILTREIPG
jgi:transglutaminase-like putative cysteine protease